MSEHELAMHVSDFVAKREDTLVQEERWRNKMMRRLGDKFDQVDARIDRLGERLEHVLASTCAEIKESVRGLQPHEQMHEANMTSPPRPHDVT